MSKNMKIKNAVKATKDLFVQGTTKRRFNIKGVLGEGGYCNVFEAHDNQTARDVALKIHGLAKSNDQFDDGFKKVFEKEVEFLSAVNHPNIITLYNYFRSPHMLVLELADGSLDDCLFEFNDFSKVLTLAQHIAKGLDTIHQAGFTHRDIKPKNVLKVGGLYKLSDFGSAGSSGNSSSIHGTEGYRAPEVSADDKYFHPFADLYSFALLIENTMKQSQIFSKDFANEKKDPNFLPRKLYERHPKNLADILIKATNYEPEERFGSATEFFKALASINTNFTIQVDHGAQLENLCKDLKRSLNQTKFPLKNKFKGEQLYITKPRVIEDRYHAYQALISYAKNFGYLDDERVLQSSSEYNAELKKDEDVAIRWIEMVDSSDMSYRTFKEEHELISAIIHLIPLTEEHDRRLGYGEYVGKDGVEGKGEVWIKHYHQNELKGDI